MKSSLNTRLMKNLQSFYAGDFPLFVDGGRRMVERCRLVSGFVDFFAHTLDPAPSGLALHPFYSGSQGGTSGRPLLLDDGGAADNHRQAF